MSSYIEMPKLSDTMTEGTLVKWRKVIGDKVEISDILAEVETDKAVMELESFERGVLSEIYVNEGGKARIGQKLALLLSPGESAPEKEGEGTGVEKPGAIPAAEESREVLSKAKEVVAKGNEHVSTGRLKASPLAKKIAAAKGVALGELQGSGPGGRVIARDVESASASSPSPAPMAAAARPAGRGDKRIPLSGMRKAIADRLLVSKTQIPHFYLNIEVDAGELVALRAELNAHLEKDDLGKLTINDFILKASVVAATKISGVNASFAGDAIIEYGDIDLSVAVAIEGGLITPVIQRAQQKSLREISAAVKDLAERARTKKLKPEEYQGGTMTVTNLGSYGIESFSAIINPPQAIILAIGAIVKKPGVNAKAEIVVGQRMAIGFSADHRVVDGAIGAQYLAELRQLLEHPTLMLL
jgi:pyruvate dehydrogenase E2 component (dihydrolipoamide acetyltransferase)